LANPLATSGFAAFVSGSVVWYCTHGDSYIIPRTTGGYYAAVYMFYGESQEQQQTITGNLKVTGITEGGVGQANLSANPNCAEERSCTNVFSANHAWDTNVT